MKQLTGKNPDNFGTKALLLGALLAAGTSGVQAQSSDALLDKLVDKGILTAQEAAELREESDKNFTTAFQTKTGMPDWVTGYKLSGDVRGRFEHISSENTGMIDRERLRYRIRVGLTVNMLDDLEAGFRLTSGETTKGATTGNPNSGNTTFSDNGSKKSIFIDTAYGKWTPLNAGGWTAGITVGKMENPFAFTTMLFDADYTPEGAAIQTGWAINDKQSLSFTLGGFMLDEASASVHDPFLYGGQLLWTAKWTPKLTSTVGGGMLSLKYKEQLTTDNVPYVNRGNTREPVFLDNSVFYRLKENFNPLIADASLTYTLDSFPFYTGTFPLKFGGEFIHNPSASAKNHGFWVGATFGKSGTKKTWDITYRYEYLEADAWYDQLVDDDNGAFYPGTNPNANSSYGYFGGTNIKGHMVKFNYSFTDSFTFSATCFITDLISLDGLVSDGSVPDGHTSATIRFMADLIWKF